MNIQKIDPVKSIKYIFSRFNLVIFIVVVSGALVITITILTAILYAPYSKSTTVDTSLDQVTINRLGGYETSANNTSFNNLPSGRINPFSE